jgi:hypothetical protein
MRRAYLIFGMVVLGGWAFLDLRGVEAFTEPPQQVPSDVQHGPGGYRSFHFWHYGFQGGK